MNVLFASVYISNKDYIFSGILLCTVNIININNNRDEKHMQNNTVNI